MGLDRQLTARDQMVKERSNKYGPGSAKSRQQTRHQAEMILAIPHPNHRTWSDDGLEGMLWQGVLHYGREYYGRVH